MNGPENRCVICGKEVVQRGRQWFHEPADEPLIKRDEACVVDGCYRLERVPDPNELHCDFCNVVVQAEDVWTLITSRAIMADIIVYEERTLETVDTQTHELSEDWAACGECHEDIVNGRWEAMVDRMLVRLGSGHEDELRGMVLEIWEEMWKGFVEWRQGVRGDER